MGRVESPFQMKLIQKLRSIFPGCVILKNDANYLQGIPDLIILWYDHYALLECKSEAEARRQPNQPYYIQLLNEWSFASFIYPQNEDQVLDALQRTFKSRGKSRVPQREQSLLGELRRGQAR